jgi:hypothetical protein
MVGNANDLTHWQRCGILFVCLQIRQPKKTDLGVDKPPINLDKVGDDGLERS